MKRSTLSSAYSTPFDGFRHAVWRSERPIGPERLTQVRSIRTGGSQPIAALIPISPTAGPTGLPATDVDRHCRSACPHSRPCGVTQTELRPGSWPDPLHCQLPEGIRGRLLGLLGLVTRQQALVKANAMGDGTLNFGRLRFFGSPTFCGRRSNPQGEFPP